MRASDSPLRLATRDLHHAAEAHPVGAAMADGTMRPEWWADWLFALWVIHHRMDPFLPIELRRADQLQRDLHASAELVSTIHRSPAAADFSECLRTGEGVAGAAYVFTGAHLMGGAITERAIGTRLPCEHLRWVDRAAAITAWQPYRSDATNEADARAAFSCVLAILDEILGNYPV
jgi:hypothetical protein